MLKNGKSKTTIGFDLRPLSHHFNSVIELKIIHHLASEII